jgi:hypothetical protein
MVFAVSGKELTGILIFAGAMGNSKQECREARKQGKTARHAKMTLLCIAPPPRYHAMQIQGAVAAKH